MRRRRASVSIRASISAIKNRDRCIQGTTLLCSGHMGWRSCERGRRRGIHACRRERHLGSKGHGRVQRSRGLCGSGHALRCTTVIRAHGRSTWRRPGSGCSGGNSGLRSMGFARPRRQPEHFELRPQLLQLGASRGMLGALCIAALLQGGDTLAQRRSLLCGSLRRLAGDDNLVSEAMLNSL